MTSVSSNNPSKQSRTSLRSSLRPEAGPQLLVSVRNREEARLALEAGVKILDVKEPDQGSLGMAAVQDIQEIGQEVEQSSQVTFSIALGELHDHRPDEKFPELSSRIDFVKVGLAGCATDSSWRGNYSQLRDQLTEQTDNSCNWVAVIYADHSAAESPLPDEIVDYAISNSLSGVLIDTYEKNGLSLLDHLHLEQIERITRRCHEKGLFLALAGSLKREQITQLAPIAADIIAVRGAVCQGQNRQAQLDPHRIAQRQSLLSSKEI